jgi:DNA helicase II / ATP-dependent DNA helicase PcrA
MPWDDNLAQDKKDIVNDPVRIKIVRAGPGSGKTTLFVAAIAKTLIEWNNQKAGIAALSFTNVAQHEIAEKAGPIPPPHLIATIDAFILRYIIKPFSSIITGVQSGIRLLPAPTAEYFGDDIQVGASRQERGRLTQVTFITKDQHGNVVMHARTGYNTITVPDSMRTTILRQKQRMWRSGLLTHSDTHYLAYRILHDAQHGDRITSLVAQRFPTILIDEYQDTNYFLAHTMRKLLAEPTVTGLVVGDTDQAIYEFGGAHPGLFDDIAALDGARTYPLRTTHRCPRRVAAIASHLADERIAPTDEEGTVQLLDHANTTQTVLDAINALRRPGDRVAIIARRAETIARLQGHTSNDFPGGSKLAERLTEAANLLPTNPSRARQIATTELSNLLFNDRHPTRATLDAHNVTSAAWRQAIWCVLRTAATTRENETWQDWVLRLRPALQQAARILNHPVDAATINRRLPTRQDWDIVRSQAMPQAPTWPADIRFDTVHGVKGDEFEIVAFYCPQPTNRGRHRCISTQWWDPDQAEERRVAYVATTRAKHAYLLCVHHATYTALQQQRPAFFACFQPIEVVVPPAP